MGSARDASTFGEAVTEWDMIGDIVAINKWLDESNPRTEHEDCMRVLKIGEELGEAVEAYIGMTGQNPRKGNGTHTRADLCMELADVAITALCALAHFTSSRDGAYRPAMITGYMASKIQAIMVRSDITAVPAAPETLTDPLF